MIAIMSSLAAMLSALTGRERPLTAGEILFRAGDPVRALFLVAAGTVRLSRALPHGAELTLQRAGAGDILAEASVFAEHYHCDAVAAEPSRVRAAPKRRVLDALAQDADLARAWTRHLALEVQHARAQAEILSLKTVAARLDAWLSLNGGALAPRGHWRQMAAEIGVAPEALYRELARRRASASRGRRQGSGAPLAR